MRRFPLVAGFLVAILSWSGPARAQGISSWTDIPVPGGTAGVSESLGLPPLPPALFIPELARHIYGVPEGRNEETDRLLGVLASYLEDVDRFDQALSAVQPRDGTVSLALAANKNGRKRLNGFLDLLGLALREKSKRFSVEPQKGKKAAERAPLLHRLGVDPAQIAKRLNAGEAVRVEVKSDPVPLPLDPATWSALILEEKVATSRLFGRVIGSRKAAMLACGLAWLDDATLLYLAQTPDLLRRLYDDHAPVFAAFGRAVRVRDGAVAVPGGRAAEPLWESVVDEKTTRPDRFVRKLLDKDDGRLAYFYDAVASLDEPHAAFALGLWIEDGQLRATRFASLAATSTTAFSATLQPRVWPFVRPSLDLAIMLARVRVQPDGGPAPPNARKLWEKVFDGADIPDDPARELRNLRDDGAIDAAWLADNTMRLPRPADRGLRVDALSFAQRVFATAPEASLPDLLVALRSFGRFRTLALTLDRIGVTSPETYAAAARRAAAIASLDRDRAYLVLAQFQASLALLTRLRAAGSLDATRAHQFARDLIALDPVDGAYRGAVARWMDSLLSALPPAPDAGEDARLLRALAGVRGDGGPRPTIEFEDRTYRVDLPGAELRRLTEVRRRQGGHDLAAVLAFARAVHHLDSLDPKTAAVGDVQRAAEALQRTGAPFKPDKVPPPPGLEKEPDPRQVLTRELRDLAKITKPGDVRKARDSARPLHELSDRMVARALMACAYALAIGDPGGTVLLGVDPSRRHDFGLLENDEELRRRNPWLLPVEQLEAGVPWHVLGSVLALEVGLSRLALRRFSGEDALERHAGFNGNHQRTFRESFALLDPATLSDADRDGIATAIGRGRARVAAARDAAALDALAAGVHTLALDGLRRRVLRWTLAQAPAEVASWLSMTELYALGVPEPDTPNLDAWGMSGLVFDACLCTRQRLDMPWRILVGQTALGMLPANVADLNLRVAEVTSEMKVPASLARPILATAVQALLDRANPADPDDWITLVRTAQRLTREEVEDYMSALTADGTLVPAASSSARKPAFAGGVPK